MALQNGRYLREVYHFSNSIYYNITPVLLILLPFLTPEVLLYPGLQVLVTRTALIEPVVILQSVQTLSYL
jgi:hypothetical protein